MAVDDIYIFERETSCEFMFVSTDIGVMWAMPAFVTYSNMSTCDGIVINKLDWEFIDCVLRSLQALLLILAGLNLLKGASRNASIF